MPPHQRKGHGRRLLQAAYDYCMAKKAVVVDIAVEEPSEGMVRLRDVVDVQNSIAQIADPATFFSQPYTVAAGKTLTEVLLLGKEQVSAKTGTRGPAFKTMGGSPRLMRCTHRASTSSVKASATHRVSKRRVAKVAKVVYPSPHTLQNMRRAICCPVCILLTCVPS